MRVQTKRGRSRSDALSSNLEFLNSLLHMRRRLLDIILDAVQNRPLIDNHRLQVPEHLGEL